MSMKRAGSLLLFLLMLTLTACGPGGIGGATPTPLPALVSYEKAVFPVERGPIVSEEDMLGEIVPSRQDELFFRSSGFTTRVTVKTGDEVKAGDVLAELQVDDLLNQIQQAEIDLEVTRANLAKYNAQRLFDIAKAEADLIVQEKRLELALMELNQTFGVNNDRARLNYDIVQQNYNVAEATLKLVKEDNNPYMEQTVKRSELSLQRLQALLAERQITAPYDAVVLRASVRPGQQIDAFFPAFVVGDPSDLVIRSPLDFDLNTLMRKDMEVRMYLERDDEESFAAAYLPNFLPVSSNTEDATRATAIRGSDFFYFSLPEDMPEEERSVGRSMNITIVLGRKEDALLLHPAAIREYRGLRFVIVQDGERRRRVEINEVGLQTQEKWEVIADLNEGDQVLGP